ncbi:hypothetical protein MTO96_047959 [Rhipicephalus appendiculatus]
MLKFAVNMRAMAGRSRPVSTRVMVLEGPRSHSRDAADDAEDCECQLSDGWITNCRAEQAFPERPRCSTRDVRGDHGYTLARGEHSRDVRVAKASCRRRAGLVRAAGAAARFQTSSLTLWYVPDAKFLRRMPLYDHRVQSWSRNVDGPRLSSGLAGRAGDLGVKTLATVLQYSFESLTETFTWNRRGVVTAGSGFSFCHVRHDDESSGVPVAAGRVAGGVPVLFLVAVVLDEPGVFIFFVHIRCVVVQFDVDQEGRLQRRRVLQPPGLLALGRLPVLRVRGVLAVRHFRFRVLRGGIRGYGSAGGSAGAYEAAASSNTYHSQASPNSNLYYYYYPVSKNSGQQTSSASDAEYQASAAQNYAGVSAPGSGSSGSSSSSGAAQYAHLSQLAQQYGPQLAAAQQYAQYAQPGTGHYGGGGGGSYPSPSFQGKLRHVQEVSPLTLS